MARGYEAAVNVAGREGGRNRVRAPMAGERRHEATAGSAAATATLLDARGLTCPLPVLKARKRLMGLAPGERLLVLATDPKAPEDFRAFCAAAGHALLEAGEEAQRQLDVVAGGEVRQ